MGLVEIEFAVGENYVASISKANGSTLEFKLPIIKEEGIAMKVDNSNSNRATVLLNRAEKNKEKYNIVKLVAQMNYQVVFTANLNIDEGQTAAPISKKIFHRVFYKLLYLMIKIILLPNDWCL